MSDILWTGHYEVDDDDGDQYILQLEHELRRRLPGDNTNAVSANEQQRPRGRENDTIKGGGARAARWTVTPRLP